MTETNDNEFSTTEQSVYTYVQEVVSNVTTQGEDWRTHENLRLEGIGLESEYQSAGGY